jgi:inhibitor of KinA sporulation pathway (predicted exonuclease)
MTMFERFLVVDLEATCDDRTREGALVPKHEMETIEIGAVLVDGETLEPVDELATFVRPVRHPILTPFCTELTTITQADVDRAPTFPEAIAALGRFLAGRPALFCSWGEYDRKQFEQDAAYHRVRLPLGAEHLNLKKRFSERHGIHKKLGMARALERVGFELRGTHHRGIDDARNIARLLPWIVERAPTPR